MTDNTTPSSDIMPPNFDEFLDKLVASQGQDTALVDEMTKSILESCKEMTAELSASFADINTTGFEDVDGKGSQEKDKDDEQGKRRSA